MDLFSRDVERPLFRWFEQFKPGEHDLFISVISLGQIAYGIKKMDPAERNNWRRVYNEGRRELEKSGRVVGVGALIVDVRQASFRDSRLKVMAGAGNRLGEDDRVILATAIARGIRW